MDWDAAEGGASARSSPGPLRPDGCITPGAATPDLQASDGGETPRAMESHGRALPARRVWRRSPSPPSPGHRSSPSAAAETEQRGYGSSDSSTEEGTSDSVRQFVEELSGRRDQGLGDEEQFPLYAARTRAGVVRLLRPTDWSMTECGRSVGLSHVRAHEVEESETMCKACQQSRGAAP